MHKNLLLLLIMVVVGTGGSFAQSPEEKLRCMGIG